MHANANEIVYIAKGLVGVPYRHQGRNQSGLDCAGLIIVIAHMLELTDKDTTNYSRRPNVHEFTAFMIEAGCTQLPMAQLAHGDILRLNTSGWPVHLGVYEIDDRGQEWYTHAYLPHKKVTRDPLTATVKAQLSSVWRFPE
jgi:cell wall-associated NlpC family hydrolase